MSQQRIAMVGFGAIGRAVFGSLQNEPRLKIAQIIVRESRRQDVQAELNDLMPTSPAKALSSVPAGSDRPDLVVECAGHSAIEAHVLPALSGGIPCLVVSTGALSAPGLAERLEAAASKGHTQVHLLSGAIAGIDALAAAKIAGLSSVVYTGRKPPLGWLGTPAEETLDLKNLKESTRFFSGSARDAARLFPKNANVAATLSLAGIGLDETRVELYADPAVKQNIHYYEAQGAFGFMAVTVKGKTLASNPKTSALTVYSVVRALQNLVLPIAI
ncbi:MAG: aspartate dehydrogenase [Burkholderiaceae bacterium]|nr:MAG: aspartate dehydrogenase [Burkholderiaceae bacterium]TAM10947.1 MAG: aspartate dehydrogenase [Pusillimonas sp.]